MKNTGKVSKLIALNVEKVDYDNIGSVFLSQFFSFMLGRYVLLE